MSIDAKSHHILRLAYCSTEEQRRWFLEHERVLFMARAERETPEQIADFMSRYALNFELASDAEKRLCATALQQVFDAQRRDLDDVAPFDVKADYYRVPFTQALDLVRSRSVLLRGGFAFVPRQRMVTALVARFRSYLSESLVAACRKLPDLLADERLQPLLANISKTYTGPEFGAAGKKLGALTADAVDELAAGAAPLCMAAMHASLKEKHRLKHLGRLQYGLYLKGAGLPLEEALIFWQREFTKGMPADEFVKKYAYNIRYNYGKEGKRTDFTAYSCVKVIMSPPASAEEVHGEGGARAVARARGHTRRVPAASRATPCAPPPAARRPSHALAHLRTHTFQAAPSSSGTSRACAPRCSR